MKEHIIEIDRDRCTGCGLCRKDCPVNNITIADKKARIKSQDCIKCGHCVAICPKAAVSMSGFGEPPLELEKPVSLDPQQLLGAIQTRRSIRHFTGQPVEREAIAQIIEAGRWTPTGENAQNVSYIVLKESLENCEKTAVRLFRRLLPVARLVKPSAGDVTIDDHFFFKKAPVAILILSRDRVNGALAASNMERMAQACGLGVLYSGLFTYAANLFGSLRRELGLRRGDKVVTTLVLGHPGVTYRRTAQKDAAKVREL